MSENKSKYEHVKVKSRHIKVMEAMHSIYLIDGWEQDGDVTTNFWGTHFICKYRKLKTT